MPSAAAAPKTPLSRPAGRHHALLAFLGLAWLARRSAARTPAPARPRPRCRSSQTRLRAPRRCTADAARGGADALHLLAPHGHRAARPQPAHAPEPEREPAAPLAPRLGRGHGRWRSVAPRRRRRRRRGDAGASGEAGLDAPVGARGNLALPRLLAQVRRRRRRPPPPPRRLLAPMPPTAAAAATVRPCSSPQHARWGRGVEPHAARPAPRAPRPRAALPPSSRLTRSASPPGAAETWACAAARSSARSASGCAA